MKIFKNPRHYVVLSTLLMMVSTINASDFTVFNKKVSFDLPKDWQSVNKEVGVPLKLLGPEYEGRRPVIVFVPIDLKEKLSFDDTKVSEENYKLGRLAWLQTFNGKTISFLPMQSYSTDNKKIEVYQFGHLYNFDNANFEEKSYYIKCKNQMYHIKSLIQVEHVQKWSNVVKKITDSFRCE